MQRYIDASPYEDCRIVCNSEDEGVPVKDIPTADVQEVRRGHWIEDKETGCLICSECGRFTDEIIGDMIEQDGKIIHRSMYPFYCSKCGADMKGGA